MQETLKRKNVFISYSHADIVWVTEIKRHFKPIEKYTNFWDDSKIFPGLEWKKEIFQALDEARIVILLISADFFASDFILNFELPYIIDHANKGELTIYSIILKPCLFDEFTDLSKVQTINPPSNPVIKMTEVEREDLWVFLLKQIKSLMLNKQ